MKCLNVWNNDKGLTLVEILASLVILGIVFVGFMTVFPQMTNFNEKTETKLLAMNEARSELIRLQKSPMNLQNEQLVRQDELYLYYEYELGEYKYKVKYKKQADVISESIDTVTLNSIEIQVYKKGTNKVSSEIFGYLKKKKTE